MQVLGNTLYHLRLLGRMGHTIGADLAQAFETGTIDNTAWAEMITNCRACPQPQYCHSGLNANQQANAPLWGCRNFETLMRLKTVEYQD